jgi:hypothetical protein
MGGALYAATTGNARTRCGQRSGFDLGSGESYYMMRVQQSLLSGLACFGQRNVLSQSAIVIAAVVSLMAHLLLGVSSVWRPSLTHQVAPMKDKISVQLQTVSLAEPLRSMDQQPVLPPIDAKPIVTQSKPKPKKVTPSKTDTTKPKASQSKHKVASSKPARNPSLPSFVDDVVLSDTDAKPEVQSMKPSKVQTAIDQLNQMTEETIASAESVVSTTRLAAVIKDGYWIPNQPLKHLPATAKLKVLADFSGKPNIEGKLTWSAPKQGRNRPYQIELKAALPGVISVIMQSKGHASDQGLKPDQLRWSQDQIFKGHQEKSAMTIDYAAKQLTVGAKKIQTVALEPEAQDILSLGFHLAVRGGKTAHSPIQVSNGKTLGWYAISVTGETSMPVGEAKLRVVALRGQRIDPKMASDDDQVHFDGDQVSYEVWLAADFANMPVLIRQKKGSDTITLKVTSIDWDHTLLWDSQPKTQGRQR